MASISLEDKYALDTTRAYITGIEALVRLPMLQHQRDLDRGLNTAGFISGYRGSPLGGLDQAIWKAQKYLDNHNIHFQPGVNEDLAATAVWGSQQVTIFEGAKYDGVFSLWYGKGPGVDRSMDVIKHANAAGTSRYGGVLAVAGDDHGCKSSSLPHQSEHNFYGASVPVLCPSNVQEVLDLGIYGWELSRYCGTWVALKAITENMDSAISAEIDPARVNLTLPENFNFPPGGVHIRWPDNPLKQEERLNKYKIYAAREFARVNKLNKIIIDSNKARLGIITTGKSYLDVMQALEDLGIDENKASHIGLRIFKVGMSWPLEPVATHEFAQDLEEILVVEEKRSIIEDQLTGQLYNWPVGKRPRVIGEFDELGKDLLPNLGELTPAMVARVIAARIRRFYQDTSIENRLAFYNQKERTLALVRERVERIPHYCSGCPHSSSTRIPEGSRALGGIGCHYMGTWEVGDRRAETFTQMGGEGATWVGQAAFTETPHVFQNLGDGTYFHSGILAIRQAIAAKVNITYKILYNDAVAMTGGQPLDGALSVENIIYQVKGEGVKRIAVLSDKPELLEPTLPKFKGLSLHHRDKLITIEKELREIKGTSILLFVQTCAAELRRRRKKGIAKTPDKHLFINTAVCEGCGDCSVESNCLSVLPEETELGRKRRIDQTACNKDFSCLKGFCPSFVTVEGASLRKQNLADLDGTDTELPQPNLPSIKQTPWNIVVTGVGGTGVLTTAAIVAMAAHIEGKGCATMNQTGLAQKFGAVTSHIRIAEMQSSINAVRIPAGDADLLIGCDLAVSVSDEPLAKLQRKRSFAVVNDYEVPTAEFVSNPNAAFPTESMKNILAQEVDQQKIHFISATEIATRLFGDALTVNPFMLGYAYQRGLIPVSYQAINQAFELNRVAVEQNKKAFFWGRKAAHDLQSVLNVVKLDTGNKFIEDLDALIDDRHSRLVDYQNKHYADRYKSLVNRVRKVEQKVKHSDGKLSKNVARYLYKVMAYKDEYEVARLFSDQSFKTELDKVFKGPYKLKFHMAPPLLSQKNKETGVPIKKEIPGFIWPFIKLLAKAKALRGTPFDIFGYSNHRKQERRIIAEYENLIQLIEEKLSRDNYLSFCKLAATPDIIRGYGHIKDKNIEAFFKQWKQLINDIEDKKISVVLLQEPAA
ncbi:MAG: indolepyruvate ferredoxin oxidoreductase family protein [Cellvibrionaceae bacterium]|nr:indolepyruvate ferredoxin oxidoreductase family protein [Cellvibrionaceae bacterium]